MSQKVQVYDSVEDLMKVIDNGGRFYNLFSKANDRIVTTAELAKAAGSFHSGKNAYMFLEIAMSNFDDAQRSQVVNSLASPLGSEYTLGRPRKLTPQQVESEGVAGEAVVVDVVLRELKDKSKFLGNVMIPIMIGETMSMTMMPIFSHFTTFEARACSDTQTETAIVATSMQSDLKRLSKVSKEPEFRIGGYIRKLEFSHESERTHNFYIEVAYHASLPSQRGAD